ncbi:MAG: SUMF1/EgtB/PvdO family nonheme iron enzyme [Planctomycetota bacterium]|jgi:formylglycine-generating enzyme required for sulfatase activity
MLAKIIVIATGIISLTAVVGVAASMPQEQSFTNSLGMKFVRIEPGEFMMGGLHKVLPGGLAPEGFMRGGDFDEQPAHKVRISKPFYMGTYEVTNSQYEKFDPSHRLLRGKLGFSIDNDEAVVFVSWEDAKAFCDWLSKKEGLPYRLQTEAEWEYACRAGTTTVFHTGNTLPSEFHKNVGISWYPCPDNSRGREEIVPLHIGKTPPNAWGLYDMHGNVEEWCEDWYGPYESQAQVDPVGPVDGDFKVTRGGSHSTQLYFLRSANRLGTVPQDRSWLIGLRLVLGEMPDTKPLKVATPPLHQRNVSQTIPADIKKGPDPDKPYFKSPVRFVNIPEGSNGPIFSSHNHVPKIVACANGDLLTTWYTCVNEIGRELKTVASRLRYGSEQWEQADIFWNDPDRNNHACSMFRDDDGTLFHFNGYSTAATFGSQAMILRKSTDHGRTWTKARVIMPEHNVRQMPVETIFRTRDGQILLPNDAVTIGNGGTAVYLSDDNGLTWRDTLGTIAGIHAAIAQLKDGSLLAFGRGDEINGKMPMSISSDMGRTWQYSASEFPPSEGGQRPLLFRLREGPLLFVSFTCGRKSWVYMPIKDASGATRMVTGMFTALSYDEGKTWTNHRLVSHDGPDTKVEMMDGRKFPLGFDKAEQAGYNSICQADNGVIHLITSRQHYQFNFKWLATPPPSKPVTLNR